MRTGNGVSPLTHHAVTDDLEGADAVATTQQFRDLDEKIDDIRSSVAGMAVSQATTAGDVKVLSTKFDGFKDTVEGRIEALEIGRVRDDTRAWIERLVYAALGAGGMELAQHWLSKG